MSFVFLSHSSRDDAVAGMVRDWLVSEGHQSIFLDHDERDGIVGGEVWEERLYTELRRCRALVALVSPDWLASPWCVAEANHAQALRKPVIPLQIAAIDPVVSARLAPPVLRRVQMIDWVGQDAKPRLNASLVRAGLDPKDLFAWTGDREPYPGFAAFDQADAPVYFGREQEITDLLATIDGCRAPQRGRLVVVQGASGSGKSSLVRAGILPRLDRNPERWIVLPPFRPLRQPLVELANVFAMALGPDAPAAPADVPGAIDRDAWASWIADAAAKLRVRKGRIDATVVVTIDQLEEALRPNDAAGHAFLLALRDALAAADYRLIALATLRADFTGSLQRHPALREPSKAGEILATRTFQLGPMQRSSFFAVIEGPAALAGLELEPGLSSQLVDDTRSDDALPLLAYVLRELWSRYGKTHLRLTRESYQHFGGLENAVGDRASEIFAELKPTDVELSKFRTTLLSGMADVSSEGSILRRPMRWDDVPPEARRIVDAFASARLLVTDENGVEVAHEALFRRWKTLADWLETAKDDLRARRRIEEAHEAWKEEADDKASRLLPPGRPLEEARDLLAESEFLKEPGLRSFVQDSIAADDQRLAVASMRRRRLVGGLAIASAVFLVLAGGSLLLWRQADTERARAETRERISIAQGLATEAPRQDPEVGALLARQALLIHRRNNGDRAGQIDAGLRGVFVKPDFYDVVAQEDGRIRSLAFSSDGKLLLAGASAPFGASERRGVTIIVPLTRSKERIVLRDEQFGELVSFSRIGNVLTVADVAGHIKYWKSYQVAAAPDVELDVGQEIAKIALSSDGSSLAVGDFKGKVRVWKIVKVGPPSSVLDLDASPIKALAFSSDDSKLAAGSANFISVWQTAHFEMLPSRLQPKTGPDGISMEVQDVAFVSEDHLMSLHNDGVRTWKLNAPMSEPRLSKTLHGSANALALSLDKSRLAIGEFRGISFWRDLTQRDGEFSGHKSSIDAIAFSPDGQSLATGGFDGAVRIWDLAPTAHRTLRGHGGTVGSIAFNPDGRLLAVSGGEAGEVRLWDMRNIGAGPTILTHERVRSLSFTPAGNMLVAGSYAGVIRLWDLSGPKPEVSRDVGMKAEAGERNFVTYERVAISPDGTMLAAGGTGSLDIKIWSLRDDKAAPLSLKSDLSALGGGSIEVNSVAFSPDGRHLAAAVDKTVQIWRLDQVRAGNAKPTVLLGHGDTVNDLIFVGNDLVASASSDQVIGLWKLGSPAEKPIFLSGHIGEVYGLAFDPTRRLLASAGADNTVRLWNVDSPLAAPLVLPGHSDRVFSVAFSPDGQLVASGSRDRTAQVWQVPTAALSDTVCEKVYRNLTRTEWDRFIGKDVAYESTCPNLGPGAGVAQPNVAGVAAK